MNLSQLFSLPRRYRPWRPKHLRLILADLRSIAHQPPGSHRQHIEAGITWLCRAQDQRKGQSDAGGVSAGWSFEDGWLPSYPETSGYIVETLLAASDLLAQPELSRRAERILDWELSIQNPDGSFPGHFGEPGSQPVIFNTGQIIHGMVAGQQQQGREECLEAAVRAGYWMLKQQDEDGCFRRNVHNGVPHTYNTRAAWGLLRAGQIAGETALVEGARRNLEWALSQQNEVGWYATNAFTPDRDPFTHTIAYAIRGLLEGGLLLGEERFVESALKAGRATAAQQRADGWLAGTFDKDWNSRANYCCLTGLAQSSLNWSRMIQARDQAGLQIQVDRALNFLKRCQARRGDGDVDDGGLPGSAPIWGDYSRFEFPNWATKFLIDSLIMDQTGQAIPPI